MIYVKHLAAGIFLLSLLGAGTNLIVDPFDIFGMPRIDGLNTHKSIGVERLAKPLQAVARKPRTVVLGYSRCLHGIDPKDVADQPAYNLSVAGALADELAALGRHVASATTAKSLILCLDFVSFNDSRSQRQGFYDDVLGPYGRIRSLPRTVFSHAALKRSRNTLRDSLRGKPMVYRRDGFRPFEPRAGKAQGTMITPVASFLSPGGAYRDFPSVTSKLAALPPLLRDLQDAGLTVTVLIPPIHAAQLEAIDEAGLWEIFEDWKRRIAGICDASGTACWDFAAHTPVSTVPLAAAKENFGDSSHFTPAIGKRILRRLETGTTTDGPFGTLLSRKGIEDHLNAIRDARERYRRKHPEDVWAVREIAIRYNLRRPDGPVAR